MFLFDMSYPPGTECSPSLRRHSKPNIAQTSWIYVSPNNGNRTRKDARRPVPRLEGQVYAPQTILERRKMFDQDIL